MRNPPPLDPPILIADHRALDFVNSWAKPGGVEKDWLHNGSGLLHWLIDTGLADPRRLTTLAATHPPAALDEVAKEARHLRTWLRDLLNDHAGQSSNSIRPARLAPLNELLRHDQSFRQIVPLANALHWTVDRHDLPLKLTLLLPIADHIGDLLTQHNLSLVRFCEGKGCVLAFLDRTKSHARRWCSMASCGNRAKAASHRARRSH